MPEITEADTPINNISRGIQKGYSPLRKLISDIARSTSEEKEDRKPARKSINIRINPRVILIASIALALTGYFYFSNRQYFWLGFFAVVGIILKFFRTRLFPLEIEPIFFFSVLLTRAYGIKYGMILEILAVVIINITNIDLSPSWIIGLIKPGLVLWMVTLFPEMSLVTIGIIAATIRSVLGFTMGLLAGVPVNAMIFVPLNPFINAAYFMNFGGILEKLL